MEKGVREELKGVKPHSKGESFSRSAIIFFLNEVVKPITIKEIIKIIRAIFNKLKIIYIKFFKLYDWKSNILIYII
jgi:hypothetical protein